MITYQRLWETMKKRGITQYHLIKREKFSAGQIGRLKNTRAAAISGSRVRLTRTVRSKT